jgi:hypothetical protein
MGKGLKRSYARLGAFAKGVAHGLSLAGWKLRDIARKVKKTDGTSPSHEAVRGALAEVAAEGPDWAAAEKTHAGGGPRSTTPALDKQIRALVFKNRGKVKATVKLVRKKLKAARKVSKRTVGRRLEEAGLAWMNRRKKTILTKIHRIARVAFARWVHSQRAAPLRQWAFTDGTTLYLARSDTEKASSRRRALGSKVWRMADGSDALYEELIWGWSDGLVEFYPMFSDRLTYVLIRT